MFYVNVFNNFNSFKIGLQSVILIHNEHLNKTFSPRLGQTHMMCTIPFLLSVPEGQTGDQHPNGEWARRTTPGAQGVTMSVRPSITKCYEGFSIFMFIFLGA